MKTLPTMDLDARGRNIVRRLRLVIRGAVQGVGFRPFIWTLARREGLTDLDLFGFGTSVVESLEDDGYIVHGTGLALAELLAYTDVTMRQLLTAGLIAEILPRLWERDPDEGRRSLESLRRLTRGALAEMRALLAELRPSILTDTDLGDLLHQLGSAFTGRTNVPVEVDIVIESSLEKGRGAVATLLVQSGTLHKGDILLAGLEYGLIAPNTNTYCQGWYMLDGDERKYRDWKRTGHGTMNLHNSIVQSCDVYFYEISGEVGIDAMHDYLSRFGLGAPTGVDVLGESSGLVPSREWKRRAFSDRDNQRWYHAHKPHP